MHVPGGMGSFGPSVDEVLKEANEAMTASVNAMFAARKRIAELERALERITDALLTIKSLAEGAYDDGREDPAFKGILSIIRGARGG